MWHESSELEKVFMCKQGDMQKMTIMEEVFPELSYLSLRKLRKLVTILEGIDFHSLGPRAVQACPKYQENSQSKQGSENGDSENQAATSASSDSTESSQEAMKTSVEEITSSESEEEKVKETEAKHPAPPLEKPQLRRTSLHGTEEILREVETKDHPSASEKQASETSLAKSQLNEDEHKTSESTMQQQEDLAETKTTMEASHKINTPIDDNSIDHVIPKERVKEGPTSEDVVVATMVADLETRNSSDLMPSKSKSKTSMTHNQEPVADTMINGNSSIISQVGDSQSSSLVASMKETHEKDSQMDDTSAEATKAIQSTDSELRKKTILSSIIAQSSENKEREAVRRHASQVSTAPSRIDSESIKDTMEQGSRETHADDDALTAVGSIDNLSSKHSAPTDKETAKGIVEKATSTDTSPVATPFIRSLVSVQEEAESKKPVKANLPQAIPSLHHQSQIADDGTTLSPRLGICEIFQLVELKHGETALLAQALERHPQLLLPREHRITHRIIALSYRVLVDILVVLATKTPYSITPSEKSSLKANLSEAIVLGFDKDWVESVRAKVFGVNMSDVSVAKEEIQVMEVKLREIDSQLKGLSEDRKKLIEEMMISRDIVSAKDKPFGI